MNPTNPHDRLLRAAFGLVFLLVTACLLPAATLTVSQLGGAAYTNIQAALDAALPGDTVLVEQGNYAENIQIAKDVDLTGADPRFTTIRPPTGNGIRIDGNVKTAIKALWITAVGGNGLSMSPGAQVRVENCVISSCGSHGIAYSPPNYEAATLFVANCTIAQNTSFAIHFSTTQNATFARWERNIFYRNGYGPYSYNGSTSSHNCVNEERPQQPISPSDITSNPLFFDADTQNYLLRPGSPCIDAGLGGPVYQDPDGTRSDLGAFGGPGAAAFWPYPPGGPLITDLQLREGKVTQGAKLRIHAVGRVR